MFSKPADVVCGQQRTGGDIALRTNEEIGEPESEKSSQGKTVSGSLLCKSVGDQREQIVAFRYGT